MLKRKSTKEMRQSANSRTQQRMTQSGASRKHVRTGTDTHNEYQVGEREWRYISAVELGRPVIKLRVRAYPVLRSDVEVGFVYHRQGKWYTSRRGKRKTAQFASRDIALLSLQRD